MRRFSTVVLVLLCLAGLFFGNQMTLTQAQGPATKAPSPTPTLTPTPVSVTVLIAKFDLTGINNVPQSISGAGNAIANALAKTAGVKVKVQQSGTTFKTAADARAAGAKAGAVLVIWGTPVDGILIANYEMLGRDQFEAQNLTLRENRTQTGLYQLPSSALLPITADLKPDVLANFSIAQVNLATADDADAQIALRAASDSQSSSTSAATAAANGVDTAAAVSNEIGFYIASVNASLDRVDTAIQNFQDVLRNTPRPGLISAMLTTLGGLIINKSDYPTAVTTLNAAIKADPNNVTALNNRGTAYRWLGNQKLAFADYAAALKIAPQDAFTLNNRGWLYYIAAGQSDSALADLNAAIKSDPKLIDAYINRLLVYRDNQRYTDALDDANTVVAADPKFELGYALRGGIYLNIGEYDKALVDLNIAIQLAPSDEFVYQDRGVAYLRLGQFDKSLADFTMAISISPSDPTNYLERANTYLNLGQYENAILDATEALSLDTTGTAAQGGFLAEAYFLRAEAYSALGRYGEAAKDYNKYVQVAPNGFYIAAAKGRLAGIKILVTVTPSPTRTPTRTPSSTFTASPSKTPTNTPSSTNTPVPTKTPTNTATPTPVPPTATPIPPTLIATPTQTGLIF